MVELSPTGGACTEAEKAARDGATCSGCGALIYWVVMRSGKRMPVDRGREQRVVYLDGEWRVLGSYKSHFASCPQAAQFRKAK
jgi:O-glycosyl hydrolase